MTYKFFNVREFDCHHTATGGENMDPEFIHNLDTLRERVGFPFRITSGWRDATHTPLRPGKKSLAHTTRVSPVTLLYQMASSA